MAEVRYVRLVEEPHGLPRMERQVPLDGPRAMADGRGRRLDFRDPERRLGLVIDGELIHRGRQAVDRRRDREAAGRGDTNLRAGWFEVVDSPCELAADVAVAQLARGCTGSPRACSADCALLLDPRLRGVVVCS